MCASDEGEDDRQCGDNIDGYFMVLMLMVM